MTYKVIYSDDVKRDLAGILKYIGDVLVEPVTAVKQVARIKKAADSLDYMPFRHRVYDIEPWKSQGIRVFPVDKFLIFYKPDELQNTVTIIRILHGSVNIERHLPPDN